MSTIKRNRIKGGRKKYIFPGTIATSNPSPYHIRKKKSREICLEMSIIKRNRIKGEKTYFQFSDDKNRKYFTLTVKNIPKGGI